MTRHETFPDAPPGSWVCEEGWLVVGDEAWTAEEWTHRENWAQRKARIVRRWRERHPDRALEQSRAANRKHRERMRAERAA